MKALLIAVIWIDLLACAWVLLQFPLIKMPTSNAMEAITANHIRPDLSVEERRSFEFLKQQIEENQTATMNCLVTARIGGAAIGGILFVQNLVLLSMLRRLKNEGADRRATASLSTADRTL